MTAAHILIIIVTVYSNESAGRTVRIPCMAMRQMMLSDWLKERFGTKVYKLSLSSGCTCPNRDGTLGTGGCAFCSEGGSGEFAAPFLPIDEQIRIAKEKVEAKFPKGTDPKDRKYIAYFQSFTNTYGDPVRLGQLYAAALLKPEICALSVGTRPDCISGEMMTVLTDLNRIKPVWIELGLQTIHERTAEQIRRGYGLSVFETAYYRLKKDGLSVILHLILGLPGETKQDMLASVRYISKLDPPPDGVKLAQLQILKNTRIGEQYQKEPFPVMSPEDYCGLLKECLEILPESVVIHRLTGDGPKKQLIEPQWSADKKRVINMIRKAVVL